jgi:hypothetical protein
MDYFLSSFCKQKNDVFRSQCGPRQNCLRPASNAQELERAMSDARNGMYQNIHLFFFRFSFAWFMRMIVSWKGRAKRECLHEAPPRDSRINQTIQLRSLSQSVKAYILTIAFSPISIHSRQSTTELVLLVWEDMAVRPQRRERHWYYREHCESNNSHCDFWHFSLEGAFRWEPHILYFIARPAITLFLHPQHTLYT